MTYPTIDDEESRGTRNPVRADGKGATFRERLDLANEQEPHGFVGMWPVFGMGPPAFPESPPNAPAPTPVPLTVAGLLGWWKADALALSDNAPVSAWLDSSGNGHTMTQGTGSQQPLYKATAINGHPGVRFDGTDDFLTLAPAFANGQLSLFIVVNRASVATIGPIVEWDDPTDPFFYQYHNWNYDAGDKMFANVVTTSGGFIHSPGGSLVVAGTPYIHSLYAGTSTTELWKNGSIVSGPGSLTGNVRYDGPMNFGHRLWTGGPLYWAGDIGEVILYNSFIASADRTSILSYLSSKWGIAL